jgi:ribosomal protein S18 acetylase RimI-like enzyme
MQGNDFLVRKFNPESDLAAVCRAFRSGFYHNNWPIIDQAEPRFIEDNILMCARLGPALVAVADGEPRGILTGFFPKEGLNFLREVSMSTAIGARVFFRRYQMTPFARAFYWRVVQGEITYVLRSPNSPAEVLLLTAQKEYRGGIGRALMDAWVGTVKARGYKKTTVATDSTLSWQFYESYGFKRVRDFPLKMYYHSLPGVEVRGYIYSLDLTMGTDPLS